MTDNSCSIVRMLTILVSVLAVHGAWAADVQIRVVDAAKRTPLSGAGVCLGTPANPEQFGALRTDAQGGATFTDVPPTPLMLTVSRNQYRGYRVQHGVKRFDVVIEVALQTGGLGPQCAAPVAAGVDAQERLAIRRFSVNGGRRVTRRRDVTVAAVVAGEPTHYRISERADFSDAEWQPFALPGSFKLSRARGTKTVYFQVRRFRDAGDASMQSVSEVVQAQVTFE